MNKQRDKNSIRHATALYRTRQRKVNIIKGLVVFFTIFLPAFSTLLTVLLSKPV